MEPIHIVGGGLAGSEAAWQAAEAGARVVLHEMRPLRGTDAHQSDRLAELVCSNSFRSDDWEYNAVGLLHAEMRRLGSLIMACGSPHGEEQNDFSATGQYSEAGCPAATISCGWATSFSSSPGRDSITFSSTT